jgi:hypothetical protein
MDNYLKWVATATLITGTLVNALGFYPLGPIILLIGGLIWLVVSIIWKEPALIVNNAILSLAGALGLLYNYMG